MDADQFWVLLDALQPLEDVDDLVRALGVRSAAEIVVFQERLVAAAYSPRGGIGQRAA